MSRRDDTLPSVAADLQDERIRSTEDIGGLVKVGIERVRGGDLGVLPVFVGLVIIWTVFQSLNSSFLSLSLIHI